MVICVSPAPMACEAPESGETGVPATQSNVPPIAVAAPACVTVPVVPRTMYVSPMVNSPEAMAAGGGAMPSHGSASVSRRKE